VLVELQDFHTERQSAPIGATDETLHDADAAVRFEDFRHDVMTATHLLWIALALQVEDVAVGLSERPGHFAQGEFTDPSMMDALREVAVAWVWNALLHCDEAHHLLVVGSKATA